MNRMHGRGQGRVGNRSLSVGPKVGHLRSIAALSAPAVWQVLRRAALALAVVICSFASASGPGAAAGTTPKEPPPVPKCYYTGSGYGSCEGYVIPGGGTIVEMTYPDKKGIFNLTGPAPLQWTKAVACGESNCVWNHLNWMVGGLCWLITPSAWRYAARA
jgi:hypothetical protein